VIHRDLKPANIMVGDFGEVLVMDWGVAKVVGKGGISLVAPTTNWDAEGPGSRPSQPPESVRPALDVSSFRAGKQAFATQSGTLIGTPAYMSPEQAQGRAVDERADLYALGVILYEILCDELPFDDEDPSRLIIKKLNEKPRRPSAINRSAPLALEMLALRLLEKDRERRTLTLPQIRTHVHRRTCGATCSGSWAASGCSRSWSGT
jgi:serine/threonine-protein kinase